MHSCHSCSSIVHRALVTYTNSSTGEIRVKIPAVTGNNTEISISRIGRHDYEGVWSVPALGEQIVVSADDENMTNVFWLQTESLLNIIASLTARIVTLENA
jgi:phage baseplate assembly protein gpV